MVFTHPRSSVSLKGGGCGGNGAAVRLSASKSKYTSPVSRGGRSSKLEAGASGESLFSGSAGLALEVRVMPFFFPISVGESEEAGGGQDGCAKLHRMLREQPMCPMCEE